MARPKSAVPSYRLHKSSGQARVCIGTEEHYLGKHNSPESLEAYARLIAGVSGVAAPPPLTPPKPSLTVDELLLAFMKHAREHYRREDGTETHTVVEYKSTVAPLRKLYATTQAADFGPNMLRLVRAEMLRLDWCRTLINSRIGKIKRIWKWGVSHELVPQGTYAALATLDGFKAGRTTARETARILPVPRETVAATLPYLNSQVSGIVQFQLLTGCRPGEACALRQCDIDCSGEIWFYRPGQHKTRHHGHQRAVAIGPRAQEFLRPFFGPDPDAFVFDPRKARACRKPKRKPKRPPGDHYTVRACGNAIDRATQRAGVKRWAPNQLRKTHGTEVRQKYGLDAAQVVLGHSNAKITEIYAQRDEALAERIAREIG